ncbi:SPOR domain-containing protein [Polaribacter sp.]|nr:SPOR domain-containing protein [Polaribacter sp.]
MLLLTGLLFITCNNNEVKKTTASEVIKAKDTIQVVQAEVIKKEPLVFKVQIAALKQPNETLSKLEDVAIFQENGLIKYRLGSFNSYSEAQKFRNRIRNTYRDAFVQALKNEVPVSILEAIAD